MDIGAFLTQTVQMGASDLFITAGGRPSVKLDGRLTPVREEKLSFEQTERLISEMYAFASRDMAAYRAEGDDDFSFAIPGLARFRVCAYRQRNSLAAVVRVVSFTIPDRKEIGIPDEIMALADVPHGLILFTGTASSGKSTTQACIIDRINHTRPCHVVTLEDPIEYLHRNDLAIVSQREIAIDTDNYLSGLRACLRQAPDVILLGEMRDAETIQTAMTAAETGHTVIATMHTNGTANSIDRIIDAFPAAGQGQIRMQLAAVLHTVVSQKLIADTKGGRVPAFEIMHTNHAIRNLIREGKTYQIPTAMQTAGEEGMQTMDQAIKSLWEKGIITAQTALENAVNPEQLSRHLV